MLENEAGDLYFYCFIYKLIQQTILERFFGKIRLILWSPGNCKQRKRHVFFILAIARLQNGAWISKIRQNMVKCSNGHLQKIMDLMI